MVLRHLHRRFAIVCLAKRMWAGIYRANIYSKYLGTYTHLENVSRNVHTLGSGMPVGPGHLPSGQRQMTREELIATRRSAIRRQVLVWGGFTVFAIVVSVLPLFLGESTTYRRKDGLLDFDPMQTLVQTFVPWGITMMCGLAVTVFLLCKGRHKLTCPHCQCDLNGQAIALVLASGNCPFCGKTVLKQPSDAN